MADLQSSLTEKSAFGDALPLKIGTVELVATDLGHMTSVSPYAGQRKTMSAALKSAHGVDLPGPNKSFGKDGCRVIWFGRDTCLLAGPAPNPKLAKHGALTDQSDGWAVAVLQGLGADSVLARLVPVDLRTVATFKHGATVRTQLQRMNVSITRIGTDRFLIMGFRSMAGTLVHDLKTAMEAVAARG